MTSDFIKEKAYAKLNLSFKIVEKLPNKYHSIQSHVTFLPELFDTLYIKKSIKNNISIVGPQAKFLITSGGDTIIKKSITKISKLVKKKISLNITLDKNIPLNSGLGGGSADAAAAIRAILKLYNIKDKIIINNLKEFGSDVPVCFYSKNSFVSGIGENIKDLQNLEKKIWILLLKPSTAISTKKIFENFNDPINYAVPFQFTLKNIIKDMNNNRNALENTVCNLNNDVKNLMCNLPSYKNYTKPRITGSGNVIYILFRRKKDLIDYQKKFSIVNSVQWKMATFLKL